MNQHRAIFEAIRGRDGEKAQREMMTHLEFVQEKLPLILRER
jgi:DNA-binding FadR family transcriptional regulator